MLPWHWPWASCCRHSCVNAGQGGDGVIVHVCMLQWVVSLPSFRWEVVVVVEVAMVVVVGIITIHEGGDLVSGGGCCRCWWWWVVGGVVVAGWWIRVVDWWHVSSSLSIG